MKKITIVFFISLFITIGCASRKTEKNKKIESIELKQSEKEISDSSRVIKKEIQIRELTEYWEIKPADSSKPMLINGNIYENAILSNFKKENETKYKEKDSIRKSKEKTLIKDIKSTIKEEVKKTDKEGSRYVIIYYFVVGIALLITYFFLKQKYNNK